MNIRKCVVQKSGVNVMYCFCFWNYILHVVILEIYILENMVRKGDIGIGDIVHQNLKMLRSKNRVKFDFPIRNFLECFQISSILQRYLMVISI